MTEEMVSFLLRQDRSDAVLAKPETQGKIQEALSYLQTQDSYVTRFLTASDTRTQLASSEVILAQASSADAAWAAVRNSNVRFFIPDEGAPGAVDCFVILNFGHSTDKPHTTACRTFLNYLLRPENAAKMVNFSKYASTEKAAAPFIDREVLNGASYARPVDMTKLSLLPVLGDRLRKIYVQGAAPLVPSSMLLQHPDYRLTKSLFGVLFEVQRPDLSGCSSEFARAMIPDQKWDAEMNQNSEH
jgi:spermidine/putrescine-binding protein